MWKRGLMVVALLCAAVSAAGAQTYPERVVRIVVPFPPGGSNDTVARVLAQALSDRMGQQFIVENRAGAGGNVGADAVAKAVPGMKFLPAEAHGRPVRQLVQEPFTFTLSGGTPGKVTTFK